MQYAKVEVDTRELIAAYLTTACIARSYKVESSHNTIKLWKELRENIPLDSTTDLAATMLSLPLIIGTKDPEMFDIRVYQGYHEQIERTRIEMKELLEGELGDDHVAAAFVANASMSNVKGGDTRKKTVQHWKDISRLLELKDPVDYLGAYLTPARIMDIPNHPVEVHMIRDTAVGIATEVRKILEPEELASLDRVPQPNVLATCTLAAAYIEISPKVEKYRDIVSTWHKLSGLAENPTPVEVIAIILMSGRIRDMDSMHLVQLGSLESQIRQLVKLLEE